MKTKNILFTVALFFSIAFMNAQVTFQQAKDSLQKYHLGSSTDFSDFERKRSYGASVNLTKDGGAAGFGHGDNGLELIKLNKSGKVQWRKSIKKQFEETEAQCVAQDSSGNSYLFMLNYNPKGYRGGCERVVCINNKGVQLWDKMLGTYTLLNNPVVSYVHTLNDGRIEMRGHIVTEKPLEGKDPVYHFWQGWLNSKGVLTSKTGDVLDWKNPEWKNKFKPE
jgi:hypothetical protein